MIFFRKKEPSELFDETTFYPAFISDLLKCKREAVIESPFITSQRMETFYPVFKELLNRKVKIHIVTRDPVEHDEDFRHQATNEILLSKEIGVNISLILGFHHRKLAILDRKILWEGSLNILSQCKSKELMRRYENEKIVKMTMAFIKLDALK